MSYIRYGGERRWTEGGEVYAYPSGNSIVVTGQGAIRPEDWMEVSMRMLERYIDDEDVLSVVSEAFETELVERPEDIKESLREQSEAAESNTEDNQ